MGVSQVLDQIYFSNLPEAARTEAVNKILEQMYPGLRGVAQLAAMKAGMANSTALQALYSHRYFSSEQNWTDHKNPIDILKQAASDGNLSKAEQETVYLKTFAKMFGNQTPVYDRAQLAELMRNPAMFVAFRTSFIAQSQKTLDGANIQLILDGFILTGTRMNEVQAKALSSYLSTHAGLKTSHLVATFKELGYTIL
jgi:hypothetical protein